MNRKIILTIALVCIITIVSATSLIIINPSSTAIETLFTLNEDIGKKSPTGTGIGMTMGVFAKLNKGDTVIFNIKATGDPVDFKIDDFPAGNELYSVSDIYSKSPASLGGGGIPYWSDNWVAPESGTYQFLFTCRGTYSNVQGTIERQYTKHLF